MPDKATTILPRPLGDLNTVMRDLDLHAYQVQELIEEGRLIAFNIAKKETTRKDFRVLSRSVEHYKNTGGKKPLVLEWPEIFRLILPHDKLYVRGTELQRSLNCGADHVENLIKLDYFIVAKKSQRGPSGSSIITRSSFENFLIGRLQ